MSCKLVAITKPIVPECETAEDLIAYIARVSNPTNQANKATASRLLQYLIRNNHWSPFEQVSLTIQIDTTLDIATQILRHRSFVFQQFSQRYAEVTEFSEPREARLQDAKNRQNSISHENHDLQENWDAIQAAIGYNANNAYQGALAAGIAKEQARVVLPYGLTMTRMYMTGNLRNWIHYCQLRMRNGTQKEHADIAHECWSIVLEHFPSLAEVFPDPDEFDALVDAFASAMKAKLREKAAEGRTGWDDVNAFSDNELHWSLVEHADEGDPVDVANYAAFKFWRERNGK